MKPLSIYLIPPVLSLLVCLSLAGIAILNKPTTTERKLFSVICLWWGLLSPAFISHHLIDDINRILVIERSIHFFYVFLPSLHILFLQHILGLRNKPLVIGAFILSGLIALTTPTNYYIQGLNHYGWGYIAKGGPIFQLFGLYGMATIVYMIYKTVQRLKKENNLIRIRKQIYLIFSFCMSGFLTVLNIPSINGYDLYPAGNFLFLPLSVLAYGVLKHRLMDVRSILLQTASWSMVSSLILLPNLFFLHWVYKTAPNIESGLFVVVLSLWFIVNYYYIRRLQPLINSRFSRNRRHLNRAVKDFISNAVYLKNLEALVLECRDFIKKYLNIPHLSVFLCQETLLEMVDPVSGNKRSLSNKAITLLTSRPLAIGRDMIETHPLYADVAPELLGLLEKNSFMYIVPLVHEERLVGLVLLPLPTHGAELSPNELNLLDQLSRSGLAFSNSAMYKKIADLKEDLEKRTVELTLEVEERQRIEEALRNSEEKHRLMAENIKEVIWTVDMTLAFTYVSPVVERMQGWKVTEFMRFSLEDIMIPESVAKARNKMTERLLYGEKTGDFSQHVTLELELYTKTGETLQTEITASFMLDNHGQPSGILGLTRDVTERVRASKEREKLQEQLARSKKMEALGMLAGGVAHDLNNILSGITSYPEIIMMDLPENSVLKKPLQTIQHSGQRAVAVVNDLVTIARGVASVREITDLNSLVSEHLASPEHVDLLARHPNSHVKVALEEGLRNISCSRIHIEKTLMNLLTNAMESLGQSGTITVSTENRKMDHPIKGYDSVKAGDYTVLTVSDTGSGISAQNLDRIFEPFYTKKMMGRSGTGLGLAIVWNTVEDHNGYITVNSSENGTRFELCFPSTHRKIAAEDSNTPIDAIKGNGETILVIDDDPTQREIASAMLSLLKYQVNTVDSGEAGVAYLNIASADLVLLDMIMPPGMNGRETYQKISRIRPGQKAIITSGFSETEEVTKAQRLGVGGLLKKPYSIENLGHAVKSALALSPSTNQNSLTQI